MPDTPAHPLTDVPDPSAAHPGWCSPARCLVETAEQSVTPLVLEHTAEPVEWVTSEARFSLERFEEVDHRRPDPAPEGFIRFSFHVHDFVDPCVVQLSAADALDLAERLRLLAGQIGGQR